MTPILMRGATALRDYVITYLEANMPLMIEQARINWELDTKSLPDIKTYNRVEPLTLSEGQYPYIAVNVINADNFKRNDVTAVNELEYLVKYSTRIFVWVKTPELADQTKLTPSREQTIKVRDDMVAVIRNLLLMSFSLGNPLILWDENTLSEEYSDGEKVTGGRFVYGAVLNLEIGIEEALTRIKLGDADTISVEPIHLLAHN